jgi:hypothetical protein
MTVNIYRRARCEDPTHRDGWHQVTSRSILKRILKLTLIRAGQTQSTRHQHGGVRPR